MEFGRSHRNAPIVVDSLETLVRWLVQLTVGLDVRGRAYVLDPETVTEEVNLERWPR